MGEAKRKMDAAQLKGVFTQYLDRQMSMPEIISERQKQLKRISQRRARDVLVYAADLRNRSAPITLDYGDILPLNDQVEVLKRDRVDVLIETPGGLAEVAEDIVTLLRDRFSSVSFIIPGWAKSAGTIMVMAGDEILMGPTSALGPIDAQIVWKDKVFSAEAFLEGLDLMMRESTAQGKLNRAHIPILQQVSPGEIQHAKNALSFAKELVTNWLREYKFSDWNKHSSTGEPVTKEEKELRAAEIATELCKHQRWLSHGRSIKMTDLESLGLKITNYATDPELYDAIKRYHALMQMTFESHGSYKLFETPTSQIVRRQNIVQPAGAVPIRPPDLSTGDDMKAEIACPDCGHNLVVQLKFNAGVPDTADQLQYPKDDLLACPQCGTNVNLAPMRQHIEQQAKRPIIR